MRIVVNATAGIALDTRGRARSSRRKQGIGVSAGTVRLSRVRAGRPCLQPALDGVGRVAGGCGLRRGEVWPGEGSAEQGRCWAILALRAGGRLLTAAVLTLAGSVHDVLA